jgi:ATP-dependent Clp protease adaptor protein ClpS
MLIILTNLRNNLLKTLLQKIFFLFLCGILDMENIKNDILTDSRSETDLLTDHEELCSLIVWNDNVNTFEWVIETLIEVCGHSPEQAEQCSYFIHFKGKYAVKEGSYDELKPKCDAITDRGIGATIEVMA